MLGNTYDKIWEDRLHFFELERVRPDAQALLYRWTSQLRPSHSLSLSCPYHRLHPSCART